MEPERQLEPLGGLRAFTHGRYEAPYGGHDWTLDVDFIDPGENLRLYRDGVEVGRRRSPGTFELSGDARIEADAGILGMRRIDLVAGEEVLQLVPSPGTPEAWRAGLAERRPVLSRAIGALSWSILVVALLTGIAELLAFVGFDPPLVLSGLANTAVGVLALLAATERALRFKSSRWLD